MAGCTYVVNTRTAMGKDGKVKVTEVHCGLVAAEGSVHCPRHQFLAAMEAEKLRDKQLQKQQKLRDGTGGMPQTRAALITRGYSYHGNRECTGCGAMIEWWKTPLGKMAPYNPMPDAGSHATSHFATCTRRADFRRAG